MHRQFCIPFLCLIYIKMGSAPLSSSRDSRPQNLRKKSKYRLTVTLECDETFVFISERPPVLNV